MKTQFKLLSGAVLLALAASANAGTVDLFSTTQDSIKDFTNGGTGISSNVTAVDGSILGNVRELNANAVSGAVNSFLGTSMGVFGGNLFFNNDSGVIGTGIVRWDGVANDALDVAGLGGQDITFSGTVNAFLLETISSDAGYQFQITAYTDATHWTEITFAATAVPAGGPSHFSTISFAGFTTAALCGTFGAAPGVVGITCGSAGQADLTKLGALNVFLNSAGTFDIDLTLGTVTTVPEPSALGLIGVGLLAAGFASRRKNGALAA